MRVVSGGGGSGRCAVRWAVGVPSVVRRTGRRRARQVGRRAAAGRALGPHLSVLRDRARERLDAGGGDRIAFQIERGDRRVGLSTSAHASASLSTMLQLTISTVSILRVRSDVAANASISEPLLGIRAHPQRTARRHVRGRRPADRARHPGSPIEYSNAEVWHAADPPRLACPVGICPNLGCTRSKDCERRREPATPRASPDSTGSAWRGGPSRCWRR